MGDREFKELMTEVDPDSTGKVCYDALLSALFLTLMFINEYKLH